MDTRQWFSLCAVSLLSAALFWAFARHWRTIGDLLLVALLGGSLGGAIGFGGSGDALPLALQFGFGLTALFYFGFHRDDDAPAARLSPKRRRLLAWGRVALVMVLGLVPLSAVLAVSLDSEMLAGIAFGLTFAGILLLAGVLWGLRRETRIVQSDEAPRAPEVFHSDHEGRPDRDWPNGGGRSA